MKKIALLFIFLQVVVLCRGQALQPFAPHVPSSPQAEAFQRFGEYAINSSTGIPDISIPLYEINARGYKIPVTLRYNPQPIKPGYNYDVLGYGWALSVSGCISRTIEYLPDEWRSFQLEVPGSDYYSACGNNCLTQFNYAHDKFSAVLPNGTSFEFVIDNQNGSIVYSVSEGRNVKINCSVSNSQITWFTVVDEDGVKYTFDGADTPYHGPNSSYANSYVSWQLSRIDLPNSSEPILFSNSYLMQSQYGTVCTEPSVKIGHYYTMNGQPDTYIGQKLTEYPPYYYRMRLLSQIAFGPNGQSKLKIIYKNPSGSAYNYIEKLQVLEDDVLIREIKLDISVRNVASQCGTVPLAELDNISISGSGLGGNGSNQLNYGLAYSSYGGFSGTDHWGYLNASPSNTMPNFTLFVEWNMGTAGSSSMAGMQAIAKAAADVNPFYKFSLSNYPYENSRGPSGPESHGVLKRITYPAGGYTQFEFENHRFYSYTNFDGNYIYNRANRVIRDGGGFRIKTIENFASSGLRTSKKNFRYGKTYAEVPGFSYGLNTHTGAGEPVVDPNILNYMNFSSYQVPFPIRNMILGLNAYGQRQAFSNPFLPVYNSQPWYWDCSFSPVNFRSLLNGRGAVIYQTVSIYDGEINEDQSVFPLGKTVYEYAIKEFNPNEKVIEEPQYFGNSLGYVARKFDYNKLLSKTDYIFESGVFRKVKREVNSWLSSLTSGYDYQFCNFYPDGHTPQWTSISSLFTGKPYYIGVSLLQSKAISEYNAQGDSVTVRTNNEYNSRNQLLSSYSLKSTDRKAIRTTYEYPQIADNGNTPTVIQAMLSKNIISPVIRKATSVAESPFQNFYEIAASKVEHNIYGTAQLILPSKKYELEIKPSGSEYVLRNEIKSYSSNGNVTELVSNDELHSSYIWGYDDRYIVAKIINANANEVYSDDFDGSRNAWDSGMSAYDSSFRHRSQNSGRMDMPGSGEKISHSEKKLNIALTGVKKFKYSGWIYSNGPSAEISLIMKRAGETGSYSYIETVRTSVIGQWVYVQKECSVPGDVTQLHVRLKNEGGGSVWFDDLRLHPSTAQMTTYTHNPLVGITSETDVRNQTIYYEYDDLQRLKLIRNHKGDILKSYEYHFKQQ